MPHVVPIVARPEPIGPAPKTAWLAGRYLSFLRRLPSGSWARTNIYDTVTFQGRTSAVYSRRVHEWPRLERSRRAGRRPPLVREASSWTSPHLRPSPWLGF